MLLAADAETGLTVFNHSCYLVSEQRLAVFLPFGDLCKLILCPLSDLSKLQGALFYPFSLNCLVFNFILCRGQNRLSLVILHDLAPPDKGVPFQPGKESGKNGLVYLTFGFVDLKYALLPKIEGLRVPVIAHKRKILLDRHMAHLAVFRDHLSFSLFLFEDDIFLIV